MTTGAALKRGVTCFRSRHLIGWNDSLGFAVLRQGGRTKRGLQDAVRFRHAVRNGVPTFGTSGKVRSSGNGDRKNPTVCSVRSLCRRRKGTGFRAERPRNYRVGKRRLATNAFPESRARVHFCLFSAQVYGAIKKIMYGFLFSICKSRLRVAEHLSLRPNVTM